MMWWYHHLHHIITGIIMEAHCYCQLNHSHRSVPNAAAVAVPAATATMPKSPSPRRNDEMHN